MLNFREVLDKTVEQRKRIRETLQNGTFHPEDASLYDGLKAADSYEVRQTLDSMSLAEVLIKGSSAMGGDSIIAAKVHDTIVTAAKNTDICALIGYVTDKWEGANLTVPIAIDGSYVPKKAAGIGKGADVNYTFTYATCAPETYLLPLIAGGDMVEDNQFGLIQFLVEKAGQSCGELASELALNILKNAPDGDGTVNTEAGAADETNVADIVEAMDENGRDEFVSNTMLLTHEAWQHSLHNSEVAGGAAGDYGIVPHQFKMPAEGFDFTYMAMDAKFCDLPPMHASMPGTDTHGGDFTNCVTLVFDRNNALFTGRKRWLELKDFANPVEDLEGAVVSFRQDSVTLYKDSICVVTEA